MDQQKPQITIITALYNHEKYIGDAIESVIAQTFSDWEYIIWDDGSKDSSLEIARLAAQKYSQKFPNKIFIHTHIGQSNKGQETTRNEALKQARGNFICLLDSDDRFHPKKLEWLISCFSNPKVGLAYGKTGVLLKDGTISNTTLSQNHPDGFIFEQLLHENFIGAVSVLIRRECLFDHNGQLNSQTQFDSRFKTCGEYPLWLKLATKWNFCFYPEVVAYWRNHGGNLGTKLKVQGKYELVLLLENLITEAKSSQTPSNKLQLLKKALSKRKYDYASELYSSGQIAGARKWFLQVLLDPYSKWTYRIKALSIVPATYMGKRLNILLAKTKHKIWKFRQTNLF